ncbi:hypothetical protein [Microbacterium sp. NPDC087591]|uniref:hypothetical protein n=1 Tax=Microbacterium sp. NPDC087591 TaxID=3364192 RepID=UPI003800333D
MTPKTGSRDVRALPSDDVREPESFEAPGQRPVYWGSADLIDLAVSLRGQNYIPTEVAVADARFERVDPDDVRTQLDELLRAIRDGDRDASQSILAEDLHGLVIEALTLQGKHSHRGTVMRLLQDGRVDVVSTAPAPENHPDEDVRRAVLAS